MTEYKVIGGGGTDFVCNWEMMKENDIEPDQFIMFTDGEPFRSWGDPDYCDTLFLIKNNYSKSEAIRLELLFTMMKTLTENGGIM